MVRGEGCSKRSSGVHLRLRDEGPTAENLVPLRLDIEIDGIRFRDVFTWNPNDPDQDVLVFARRTVRDLKLPPAFITQISQSIQHQLNEFRALQGQDMYPGDKMVLIKIREDLRVNHTLIKDQFLWDLNNFESDPEEFAKTLCKDMNIKDPEVGDAWTQEEELALIDAHHVYGNKWAEIAKDGRVAEEDDTLPDGHKLSKGDGVFHISYDMGRMTS
ncbi:hypothetical protein QQ045_025961 [Rhodiola kirilowii]